MPKIKQLLSGIPLWHRIAVVLFIVILLLFATFWIYVWLSIKPFQRPDTTGWRTGDIFFSVGNSWRSVVVKMFDSDNPEGLTHCGFVIVRDGQPMLVHMSTDKNCITCEGIDEYGLINDVSAITVRRLRNLPDTTRLRVALEKLLRNGKEFDHSFDHRDASKYYCSELVVRELQGVGCNDFDDLLDKDHIYPVEIANSHAVQKVTCPP